MAKVVVVLFVILLIVGIANAPDDCTGTDNCHSEEKYKFSEHQAVVGEKISLYESNIFKPIERCYIKADDQKYRGEVTKGIVNPTQEDLDRLGYPECVLPQPADNSIYVVKVIKVIGLTFAIAAVVTCVIFGGIALVELLRKRRRASA